VLAVRGLRHAYDGRSVLAIDEWSVPQGEASLVLGASGSGKSTLLAILAGLLKPSAGEVTVADSPLSSLGPRERDAFRARNVGIVLQKLHLIGILPVRENLRIARRLAGLDDGATQVQGALESLGIGALASRKAASLSVGEAQRVAIARAVVNRPRVILADEPTGRARRRELREGALAPLRAGGRVRSDAHRRDPRSAHRRALPAKARAVNVFRLALAYLAARPLLTALHVMLLSLGTATLVVLLLFTGQAERKLEGDAKPVDLVVGAKGSPLQLILSSVLHVDVPTGNIPYSAVKQIAADPMVQSATPLSLATRFAAFASSERMSRSSRSTA
jgi:putative ABC transport system ATP-binding protein